MKIGILTQALQDNYGGLLQNYALQQVLIRMGHEPVTLDWNTKFKSIHRKPLWKVIACFLFYPILFIKRKMLFKKEKYKLNSREKVIINQFNDQFIKNNIFHTQKFSCTEEIIEYVKKEKINTFIVGSDQVWRPKYNAEAIYQMFLYFAKDMDVKRIAYAASFGTDNWEFSQELTQQVLPLIKKFDSISVRENSAISLCRKYFDMEGTLVLDPTLMLNIDDYSKLINKTNRNITSRKDKILFHYILDPSVEKLSFIDEMAKSLNMVTRTVLPKHTPEFRTKEDVKNDIEGCVLPGPIAWLEGFQDASMVICDSFHGAVFSIIFNKPFWIIGNQDRGMARFNSLLSIFGLQERLIDIKRLDHFNISAPIEWERVNSIRKEWINTSMSFLSSAGL